VVSFKEKRISRDFISENFPAFTQTLPAGKIHKWIEEVTAFQQFGEN